MILSITDVLAKTAPVSKIEERNVIINCSEGHIIFRIYTNYKLYLTLPVLQSPYFSTKVKIVMCLSKCLKLSVSTMNNLMSIL